MLSNLVDMQFTVTIRLYTVPHKYFIVFHFMRQYAQLSYYDLNIYNLTKYTVYNTFHYIDVPTRRYTKLPDSICFRIMDLKHITVSAN